MAPVEAMSPSVQPSPGNPRGTTLKYSDADVDQVYQTPTDFNLAEAVADLTTGCGYTILKNVFSPKDIEMAKERILQRLNIDMDDYTSGDKDRDFGHNNFSGMDFNLFQTGMIFAKFVAHPDLMAVSKAVCGNRYRLSSHCSNTVPPGCGGQKPHLDYPYYREMWPESMDAFQLDPHHVLSMVQVICCTDFTEESGATAMVPYSQLKGQFPDNEEEFMKNCKRLVAKAGDVAIISGRLQHCAMPNTTTDKFRVGIIQQSTPLYVNAFQDMTAQARDWHPQVIKDLIVLEPPKW